MTVFLLYMLFALTTALTSIYELIHPVFVRAKANSIPITSKGIWYFTFFLLNTLAAPLVFLSCIIPSFGERFRDSLYTVIKE